MKTTLDWWLVKTGHPNDEQGANNVVLGTFYGHVDEIALRLADKQSGFWCDGKLTFIRTKQPRLPSLPVRVKVNVVVEEIDWEDHKDLMNKNKRFFASRPVRVEDCSQYGTITIVCDEAPT